MDKFASCLQLLGLGRSKDTELVGFGSLNYKDLFTRGTRWNYILDHGLCLGYFFKSIKAWPHITPNVCKAPLPYIYSVAVLKPRRKWPITRGREAAARWCWTSRQVHKYNTGDKGKYTSQVKYKQYRQEQKCNTDDSTWAQVLYKQYRQEHIAKVRFSYNTSTAPRHWDGHKHLCSVRT